MTTTLELFIAEDHHFIAEAYKTTIEGYKSPENYVFASTQVRTCERGYYIIEKAEKPFDIAFFDLNMPTYPEKNIHSGKDLALFLKEKMPNCKILVMTMESNVDAIKNVISELNPEGIAIKNDLGYKEMLAGLDKVIRNKRYYSKGVISMIAEKIDSRFDFDQFDREIIICLEKGIDLKNLDQYVPLLQDDIEKRFYAMEHTLFVKQQKTTLVDRAKKLGLI
jgi:DNA-binding NarL/FixJ family response regulator